MSFFDSFKKGFEDQNEKTAERQAKSRALEQEEYDHFCDLNRQSDSILLNKLNGIFMSVSDKKIVEEILISRGYKKTTDGTFHRL